MEKFEERVEAALRTMPVRITRLEIHPSDPGRIVAVVESPDFAGKPGHERQALAWGAVVAALPEAEWRGVEFIFTELGETKAA